MMEVTCLLSLLKFALEILFSFSFSFSFLMIEFAQLRGCHFLKPTFFQSSHCTQSEVLVSSHKLVLVLVTLGMETVALSFLDNLFPFLFIYSFILQLILICLVYFSMEIHVLHNHLTLFRMNISYILVFMEGFVCKLLFSSI